MNFKKTCKSIVSFVLGTGMMFSGFAFNSHPNAIFSKEFYAENLEKYKGNKNMELLLASLEKLQENREKLSVEIPEELIIEAEKSIGYGLTKFVTAVSDVTEALNSKEDATLIFAKAALKGEEKCDELETALPPFFFFFYTAITEMHKPDRNIALLCNVREQLRKRKDQLEEMCETLKTAEKKTRKAHAMLDVATARAKVAKDYALACLDVLLALLIALSVCETDETNHLCLDTLAPQIETLFGGNSTELEMHIRDTVNRLLGDETYERVVKSIID